MPSQRTARPWTRTQLAIAAAAALAAAVITLLFALNARGGEGPPGPTIEVSIAYRGASAAMVETDIVMRVEAALGQLDGVRALRSISEPGRALVQVTFEATRESDAARRHVNDAFQELLRELPSEAGIPNISHSDPDAPLLGLSLSGPQPPVTLSDLADHEIKRRLERLPGVGAVLLEGAAERRIAIRPDLARLAATGLALADLQTAVRDASSVSLPGGRITPGGAALRVDARLTSLESLADLVVPSQPPSQTGAALRLRDVATVEDGVTGPTRGPVSIIVQRHHGVPRADVLERVQPAIAELRRSLPAGAVLDEAPLPARPPAPPTLRLSGPDREELRRLAAPIEADLRASGAASIERVLPGRPEQHVELDRDRIARLGIHIWDVTSTLDAATGAVPLGSLFTGGREIPIQIVLDGDLPAALALLHVRAPGGSLISLASLVTVTTATSEPLLRHAREPALELAIRPTAGHSLSSVRRRLTELTRSLPVGYRAVLPP